MPNALPYGIYAILDLDRVAPHLSDDPDEELTTLKRYVVDAADAGAAVVQLRAKSVPGHSLWLPQLIAHLREALAGRIPLVVNDHVGAVELLTERAGVGVHLGQDDATPQHGRARLGDDVLIGLSTHSLAQLEAAAATPADYVGFGPVFATTSKTDAAQTQGLEALGSAVRASHIAVVAIGGIGLAEIPGVVATGARCAAVITAWLGEDGAPNGPNFARMAMVELVAAWREAKVNGSSE